MSQVVVSAQGHPSGIVAAIPAQAIVAVVEGQAINSAQAVVNPVIAVAVVARAVEDELSVDQSVHLIVAQHHVTPVEVQQRHIPQIDDVICIAVNLIAVVVEIVERSVKERSEGDAQDAVDNRSGSIGVPTSGNYRAIPYEGCGTEATGGRRQWTTPVVVSVVPLEVVAIAVVAVVKAVVGIVAVATRLIVARFAARTAVTTRTVTAITRLAVAAVVNVTGLTAVTGLAAIAGLFAVARLAAIAGLAAVAAGVTLGLGGDTGRSDVYLALGTVVGQVRLAAGIDGSAIVAAGCNVTRRGCAGAGAVAAAHGRTVATVATVATSARITRAGVTAAVHLRTGGGSGGAAAGATGTAD